jgi:hypothetical protein
MCLDWLDYKPAYVLFIMHTCEREPWLVKDNQPGIGNFFYDLKPTRDAGVGLTEQTIDYIVDVKGEPEWLREFSGIPRRSNVCLILSGTSSHG